MITEVLKICHFYKHSKNLVCWYLGMIGHVEDIRLITQGHRISEVKYFLTNKLC